MMAVFLREPDIIAGVPRVAGELVTVPDDYDPDNIAQVVQRQVEQANQQRDERLKRDAEDKRERRKKEKEDREKPPKDKENGRR